MTGDRTTHYPPFNTHCAHGGSAPPKSNCTGAVLCTTEVSFRALPKKIPLTHFNVQDIHTIWLKIYRLIQFCRYKYAIMEGV